MNAFIHVGKNYDWTTRKLEPSHPERITFELPTEPQSDHWDSIRVLGKIGKVMTPSLIIQDSAAYDRETGELHFEL